LIHAIVDMSKKANPTLIGLFFVVGFALTITGLLLFSSRSLFHPQVTFILYFEDSLKGLEPGAPVKFRGVTIGSVVEVLIRHNQPSNDHSMPVIIAIDKEMAQSKSDEELQFDKNPLESTRHSGLSCSTGGREPGDRRSLRRPGLCSQCSAARVSPALT
jgi:hypothetical protein